MTQRPLSVLAPVLLSLLLACSSPTPETPPASEAPPPPPEPQVLTYEGIDVSHFQGTVDWDSVQGAGITFGYAKATEGKDDVDPQFTTNWQWMQQAGMVRGAYHFFYPNIDTAAQAQHFIDTVTLEPGDLRPMLDVELSESMDAATIAAEVLQWLETVEAHYGVAPLIYSNKKFIETYLGGAGLERFPLWLAEYTDETPDPAAWSDWEGWTLWQYSQGGQVAGVTGDVDRDRFVGTAEAWDALRIPASSP